MIINVKWFKPQNSQEILLSYNFIFNRLAAWQSLNAELQMSDLKIPACAALNYDAKELGRGCSAVVWYLGQYLVHLQTFVPIKINKYLKAPPPAPMAKTEIWCSDLFSYLVLNNSMAVAANCTDIPSHWISR